METIGKTLALTPHISGLCRSSEDLKMFLHPVGLMFRVWR